jgi:hypothetical protein
MSEELHRTRKPPTSAAGGAAAAPSSCSPARPRAGQAHCLMPTFRDLDSLAGGPQPRPMARAPWTRRGATVSEQVEGLTANSPDPSLPKEKKRIFAEVLKLNPKVAADPTGTKALKAYFNRVYDEKLEKRSPGSKKKAKKKKK